MALPTCREEVPYLTTDQMIEVDRLMVEEYHIDLIQMMENAGRNLADLARLRFLAEDPLGKKVIVLAGTGGNGGGAMVCARRLHNWGAKVEVVLTRATGAYGGVPAHQLQILQGMRVPMVQANAFLLDVGEGDSADVVIDGLIGYSLSGAPRGAAAELIRWANEQRAPILALDVPSGLDSTSGQAHEPTIRARASMTLALPKVGLRGSEAGTYVGELYLADISVPPALYASPPLGLRVGHIFAQGEVVRLKTG